ncbi:hypothetical protein Pth03_57530 [Planotetraspora thailandica]|uniref:Glycosyl hydrolase family 13 catalytic domain-containing protein n=1 Tax=Planotetraspora thailandica TaxID=487172 RepID=A0A8J3XY14_9ACTN|nr:hypothetical protein [Planotetraspora thailandica]GII57364.1 hypothetical protein Pth03_57530 [Planotetraspora thailandica]
MTGTFVRLFGRWPTARLGIAALAIGLGASALTPVTTAQATSADAQVVKFETTETQAKSAGIRTAATTESSAFAEDLESKYIDPDRIYSTDVRWWLGDASQTDETLLQQIQDLYDGGFRGVELCMQNDSSASDADPAARSTPRARSS